MKNHSENGYSRAAKVIEKAIIALVLVILAACKSDDSSERNSKPDDVDLVRPYYMGFTPWPYDDSPEAVLDLYSKIQTHGDIVKHHLTQGIPWQSALDGTPLPTAVENEINFRLDLTSSSQKIYLALDALNFPRDGLALLWRETDNQPLPPEWANKSFDDPDVINAYLNFAEYVIDRFNPDYFSYTSEISELMLNDPAAYDEYVIFAEAVYAALKERYPNLPILVSIALKSPDSQNMAIIEEQFKKIFDAVDMVGVSAYPYAFFDDELISPQRLADDWIDTVKSIAGSKPITITETGWIAEDLTVDSSSVIRFGSPEAQSAYTSLVLEEAERLSVHFVIWYSLVDYDYLWETTLNREPVAALWKDIGLYDEDLNPRPALEVWDSYLNRTYAR